MLNAAMRRMRCPAYANMRRSLCTLVMKTLATTLLVCCCLASSSARAIECLSAPDQSASVWWSWREIDGRKCWYKKVGAVPPKSEFVWPEQAKEAAPAAEAAQPAAPAAEAAQRAAPAAKTAQPAAPAAEAAQPAAPAAKTAQPAAPTPTTEGMTSTPPRMASAPHIEIAPVKPVDLTAPNFRLGNGRVGLTDDFDLSSFRGIGGAWEVPDHIGLALDSFDARYGRW